MGAVAYKTEIADHEMKVSAAAAEQLKNLVAFFRLNGNGDNKNESKNKKITGKKTGSSSVHSVKSEVIRQPKKETGFNISIIDDTSDSDYTTY